MEGKLGRWKMEFKDNFGLEVMWSHDQGNRRKIFIDFSPGSYWSYTKSLEKVGAAFAECRSKENAQTTFEAMFGPIQKDPTDFVRRFVTMDETWVHHYTLETNSSQSSGWKPMVQRQRKRSRSHLLERSRPVWFGMPKGSYSREGKLILEKRWTKIHNRKKRIIDRAPILQAAQHPTTASRSDTCPMPTRSFVHTSWLAYH
ncbi:DAGLA [Cordylochernes scorpioides]|uniref:DAGLA n=1 Tax=Cordylochernes scorpioides TaxID=51811 RepID=A0ABY6KUS2_9ARAC|nr:DAGLA [Cordylochernes scorpioides]